MKKRILHVIGALSKGGAEHQCSLLLNGLDRSKYEPSVLYFYEGPKPTIYDDVKRYPIERGEYWALKNIINAVNNVMEAEKPDLVQVWLPELISVPAAIAAKRSNVPIISCHRSTFHRGLDLYSSLRDRIRGIQHILANRIVSNFAIDEEPLLFRFLYKYKKGLCIHNGLDLNRFDSLERKELPVRAKYRIIFTGRLVPQKGLPVLFKAIKVLVNAGKDVHLTLFGEGSDAYTTHLKKLVLSLGIQENITFFGFCPDWQAYAQDAMCLAFPSTGEGTSNVVIEALAIGLPVVISNIAMSRQLLTDQKNACVVSQKNPFYWAETLKKVIDDTVLKKELVFNGRSLSKHFEIKRMVSKYDELYQDVLNQKRKMF